MHPPKKAQLEERRVSPEVRGEARWPLVSAAVVRRRASGCARVSSSMQALPAPHDTGTGSIWPRFQRSATPGDDMAHLQSVSTKAEALRAEIVRVTIEFRPVICSFKQRLLWRRPWNAPAACRGSRSRCAKCPSRPAGSGAGYTRRRSHSPSHPPALLPSRCRRHRPMVLWSLDPFARPTV
jgi:hypothetical protein